jgi:hypothetical protein
MLGIKRHRRHSAYETWNYLALELEVRKLVTLLHTA